MTIDSTFTFRIFSSTLDFHSWWKQPAAQWGRIPSERTQRPKYLVLLVSGFSLIRLVLSTPNTSSLLAASKSEAVTKGEEDTARDCLRHSGQAQVLETRWDAITGAVGAGQYPCMASLNHFWKVMVTRRGSLSLEKDYTCPQWGKEENLENYTLLSYLNSWKGYGANPPLSHFQAHTGWERVWEQPATNYHRQVTANQPGCLPQHNAWLHGQERSKQCLLWLLQGLWHPGISIYPNSWCMDWINGCWRELNSQTIFCLKTSRVIKHHREATKFLPLDMFKTRLGTHFQRAVELQSTGGPFQPI